MAVLAMILPLVSRSSKLSVELFRAAAESKEVTSDFISAAQGINRFASILKQIGTIIKEDDRLPSHEAIEILEDVIEQSRSLLTEIDTVVQDHALHERDDLNGEYSRQTSSAIARLNYLASHLEALRTTLSVLLQTLYTAQSIMWSKLRPTISPQQTSAAVANEKIQLEALIIEQQMAILKTSVLFEQESWNSTRLLTESDSSLSLVSAQRGRTPNPGRLYRYQYQYIAGLDASGSNEPQQLKAVCSSASSQSEHLIEKWTSLPDFYQYLRNEEREARKQKQELQQPTVESDSEDDSGRTKLAGNGARMMPQKPGMVQPLFSDASSLPIPMPTKTYGPAAPLSPAASPKTSRNSLPVPPNEQSSPVSPRSSIASLPVNAAAAVEAKEDDDDVDLEIPWTLCTRKYYWKFVDGKQTTSNTEQHSSLAFLERNSWTEIMASWVCKEAIKEADYDFTQVQKDVRDGRRTKFETCFCIERPLQFDQVKLLVERTVEIYRKTAAPTPPPQARRSSFHRPPPIISTDRNRTPVARNTHPPLERSLSNMPKSTPLPPPMDRSLSMPGVPQLPGGPKPRTSNLQIPIPPQGYAVQPPSSPHSPRMMHYAAQAGPYSPHMPNPQFQQSGYPLLAPHSGAGGVGQIVNTGLGPLHQPQNAYPVAQLPQGYASLKPPRSRYEDTTTSDSEQGERERERARRHRSKSRSRYASGQKKKSHGTSGAVGALMGIGGLTALLDGLSGL